MMMAVRRYKKDPRTKEQQDADNEILDRFERGKFLVVDPTVKREALDFVKKKNHERRELVAQIAGMIGRLRKQLGISQEEVAKAIGTQKTFISRIESGRYGGITFERFLAMFQFLSEAATGSAIFGLSLGSKANRVACVHHDEFDLFDPIVKSLE